MNWLYVKSTLETDQNKLRMLNFDLMMQWQGVRGVGRFVGIPQSGADVTAVTPALTPG